MSGLRSNCPRRIVVDKGSCDQSYQSTKTVTMTDTMIKTQFMTETMTATATVVRSLAFSPHTVPVAHFGVFDVDKDYGRNNDCHHD